MKLSTNTVLYETRNNIAYITLNRPESLNALSREVGRGAAGGDGRRSATMMTCTLLFW